MALFGGMPFPVQFFLAFIIVLGLIGATAWAVKRFGAGALGRPGLRGRQPRLAVLEQTLVEGRRRLYLVRRDNVEHLLLIGGPTDIVVEPNIVRAVAPPRDTNLSRPAPAMDALSRAIPLPDSPGNGSWPLQPEPAVPAAPVIPPRPPRHEPATEQPPTWPLQPQADGPARIQRDTLAALADEISTRQPPRNRPQPIPRPLADEPRSESRSPALQPPARQPADASDQSLAEMAHRLEAALRKPGASAEARDGHAGATMPPPPPMPPRPTLPAEQIAPADMASPGPIPPGAPSHPARPADPAAPRSDGRPPGPGKALYDSLEQEMASLLGRPAGKT